MREVQTFTVDATVTDTRRYRVDARSPEEAESIVEGFIEDGEEGALIVRDVAGIEAIPEEDLEAEAA